MRLLMPVATLVVEPVAVEVFDTYVSQHHSEDDQLFSDEYKVHGSI